MRGALVLSFFGWMLTGLSVSVAATLVEGSPPHLRSMLVGSQCLGGLLLVFGLVAVSRERRAGRSNEADKNNRPGIASLIFVVDLLSFLALVLSVILGTVKEWPAPLQ